MKPTLPVLCATGAACVALAGCANPSPEWDARFGDAVRQSRASQVVDPAAPGRKVPLLVDSKATAGAQTNYATSYGYAVKEARPPALTVTPNGK